MKEAYVLYPTAELLKEKGFDWECYAHYNLVEQGFEEYSVTVISHTNKNSTLGPFWISAPTQQMAIRWFWEEKGLNINAIYGDYPSLKKSYWMPQIDSLDGCYGVDDEDFFREYDSREECIEAALKYALNNLI